MMKKLLFLLSLILLLPVTAEEKNNAVIPVPKLEKDFYDWYKRHEKVKETIKQKPVDLVFIGDSITHMFGGKPQSEKPFGEEIWKKYYSHRNAVNMGFGWDRTQNVLWRLDNGAFEGISPKVVVILIGTNNMAGTKNCRSNSPKEIFAGIKAVCEKINKKSPHSQIILLKILPRSPEKFVKPIRETNELISTLDKLEYVNVLDVYKEMAQENGLPKKGTMRDTVHPSVEGYKIWARTLEPVLSTLLKDKAVQP